MVLFGSTQGRRKRRNCARCGSHQEGRSEDGTCISYHNPACCFGLVRARKCTRSNGLLTSGFVCRTSTIDKLPATHSMQRMEGITAPSPGGGRHGGTGAVRNSFVFTNAAHSRPRDERTPPTLKSLEPRSKSTVLYVHNTTCRRRHLLTFGSIPCAVLIRGPNGVHIGIEFNTA